MMSYKKRKWLSLRPQMTRFQKNPRNYQLEVKYLHVYQFSKCFRGHVASRVLTKISSFSPGGLAFFLTIVTHIKEGAKNII